MPPLPPLCQSHCDLMTSLLAKLRLYHPCSGIRCQDFTKVLYNDTERMITINGKFKKNKRFSIINNYIYTHTHTHIYIIIYIYIYIYIYI